MNDLQNVDLDLMETIFAYAIYSLTGINTEKGYLCELNYGTFSLDIDTVGDEWSQLVENYSSDEVSQQQHRLNCSANVIGQLIEDGYGIFVTIPENPNTYEVWRNDKQIIVELVDKNHPAYYKN